MVSNTLLKIENLSKSFGENTVLKDIGRNSWTSWGKWCRKINFNENYIWYGCN